MAVAEPESDVVVVTDEQGRKVREMTAEEYELICRAHRWDGVLTGGILVSVFALAIWVMVSAAVEFG
ncbi:MAG: hypothetical protein AAGD07_15350 [Planctomycetota bacterium]